MGLENRAGKNFYPRVFTLPRGAVTLVDPKRGEELIQLGPDDYSKVHAVRVFSAGCGVERAAGIEPAWPAWKAGTLPLSYARRWRCCGSGKPEVQLKLWMAPG
jgi:hypothetical protein